MEITIVEAKVIIELIEAAFSEGLLPDGSDLLAQRVVKYFPSVEFPEYLRSYLLKEIEEGKEPHGK